MALGLSGLSGLSGVSGAPALPPVTRTLQIAAGADDATAVKQGAAYPPGGATTLYGAEVNTIARKGAVAGYTLYSGILRWSRGAVPAGLPSGLVLRVYGISVVNDNGRDLVCEWITLATPGTITTADYAVTAATTAGTFALSGLTTTGYKLLTLGTTNFPASGEIALRMTISGGVPAGDNYFNFASFDNVSGYDPPQLAVTSLT